MTDFFLVNHDSSSVLASLDATAELEEHLQVHLSIHGTDLERV